MKTISLPIYNRPDALLKTLESLRRNNCEGYELFVSIDGKLDQIRRIIGNINWIPVMIHESRKLGLSLNTFLAPSLAFAAGSDFNVYLEDDLILSPDALDLCNWYYKHSGMARSDEVGLVLWRSSILPTAIREGFVTHQLLDRFGQGGHGNGFACTRHQWEIYWRKEWFGYGHEGPGQVWDVHTDNRLRELGKHVLSPLYPRSVQQNVKGTSGKGNSTNPLVTVPIYDGPPVKEFKIV